MEENNPVLGYDENNNPIIQPRGYIYTQAFILCRECNNPISSVGGPMYNSICIQCYNPEKKQK